MDSVIAQAPAPSIAGGAVAGGLGMLGSLASSALNAFEQSQNRDMQIDLANTAHQRETKDLIAAGLNPILSVNHGAPTPSLQAPQVQDPSSSAMSVAQGYMAMRQAAASTRATSAQATSQGLDNIVKSSTIENSIQQRIADLSNSNLDIATKSQQIENLKQQLSNLKLQNTMQSLEVPGMKNQAGFENSFMGRWNPYLNSALDAANSVSSLLPYSPKQSKRTDVYYHGP